LSEREERWNLPNLISLARIALAVVVAPLLLVDSFGLRITAFVIFLAAALSDIWDGHIARSQGLVTDLGKLLDPLADKLLLAATFVPFLLLSHGWEPQTRFPWFGGVLPIWVVVVIFGRELFITLFRGYAARRGVIIAAGQSGKYKTIFQLIAVGAIIMWYALHSAARGRGWLDAAGWGQWLGFHYLLTVGALSIAIVLTVYSMLVYLWGYRSVVTSAAK
jgi:CDP-diacylglycerol---glycerol-3-phosphate 3-phosphatidyltransferase